MHGFLPERLEQEQGSGWDQDREDLSLKDGKRGCINIELCETVFKVQTQGKGKGK